MGGVGIFIAFMASYALTRDPSVRGGGLLVACSSAMAILGFVDDLVQLKPYAKLVGQLTAATALTAYGLQLPWTPWLVVNQSITIFWLVGVTNALNLLDNIDGLAGGVAAIAGAFMTYFFYVNGQAAEATLMAGFVGALAAFLVFNFNPASIFMGDSGSLFIGFFLGGAALLQTANRSRNLVSVLAPPVLILAIPIIDTTLVTVMRKLNGRPVSQGGRDHTSHRLVALGFSERGATLSLWALAIASGLAAVVAYHFPASVAMALLPAFVLVVTFLAIYLGRVSVYKEVSAAKPDSALLPTLAEFSYKRRIFEVLNDFAIIVLAYYGAFLLRFEGALPQPFFGKFLASLPLVACVEILVFLGTGVYRGLWRYTGVADLRRLLGAVSLASVASVVAVGIVFGGLTSFSRTSFILNGMLLLLGIAGSRVSFRLIRDFIAERTRHQGEKKRVVIYGAGDGGEMLLRELRNNDSLGLLPVAFIDDDPYKVGKVIHGVEVLGTSRSFASLLPELEVHEVVVSMGVIDEGRLDAVDQICREHSIRLRRARFGLDPAGTVEPSSLLSSLARWAATLLLRKRRGMIRITRRGLRPRPAHPARAEPARRGQRPAADPVAASSSSPATFRP
jgi:UDP-GlcNAc:undecaprenyl-phosphate GlcNAc-1-phosphate transferase